MLQALDRLRRTDKRSGAAAHDIRFAGLLVDLAQRRRAAARADMRKLIGLRAVRPLLRHHFDDLRNDVAGALHDDRIADANILARDLVFIVQRGVLHDDAADRHRLEPRDRRQRAGAADLNLDVAQNCRRAFGRELMRDGPARRARDEAEPLLQRDIVDLVDDAVDVIAERRALRFDRAVMRQHVLRALAERRQRIDRQPVTAQRLKHAHLRLRGQRARLAPAIGEEMQRP